MTRPAAMVFSGLAHAGLLGSAIVACLLSVDPVPEPPIVLRFVPGPPLAMIDRLSATPAPEAPAPEAPAPEAPARASLPAPQPQPEKQRPSEAPAATEPVAAAADAAAAAAPPDSPAPPIAGPATPALAEKDTFSLPAPTGRYLAAGQRQAPTAGVVGSVTSGTATPETESPGAGLLNQIAGRTGARARIAGIAGVPAQRSASLAPETRAATVASADIITGGGDSAAGDPAEVLGHRYRLQLVDARDLGHSTHEGWRYNQLLPLLSEAYRKVALLPHVATHAIDDDIQSVRVDPDAVVIAYADGTRHVVAPTRDGLVALYVSTGAAGRTKIDEMQRALAALRRLLDAGDRS